MPCVYLRSYGTELILRQGEVDGLRASEMVQYVFRSSAELPSGEVVEVTTIGFYSVKVASVAAALYGIYMTLFILFLLVVCKESLIFIYGDISSSSSFLIPPFLPQPSHILRLALTISPLM